MLLKKTVTLTLTFRLKCRFSVYNLFIRSAAVLCPKKDMLYKITVADFNHHE
jgi:hypothetical protein